jgi:dTDP-4-dehydrorhamnose reductase
VAVVLVTGASGLVGSRLVVRLRGAHEVHGTFHEHPPDFLQHPREHLHALDVRDLPSFRKLLEKVHPEIVFHCAAMTDVDGCESAPEEAIASNVAPVEALGAWQRGWGARLVLMSTDYVFDGKNPPYEVDAEPNPLCVYSRTKAQAEAIVRAVPDSLVARSTVIYGADFGHLKRNFATWLLGELKAGRPVRVVDDQWNTPTLSENIAEFLEVAVQRGTTGVIHTASSECVSRFEFARRVARRFELEESLIAPVKTSELKQPAKRPERACLSVERTERALGVKAWSIAKSLDVLHKQMLIENRPVLRPWW